MNKTQLIRVLQSISETAKLISVIAREALEKHEAGKVIEAEETYVYGAGELIRSVCGHFFDLDKVQSRDLPQIAREIAKLLVNNGQSSKEAKDYAQRFTAAASNFRQMEKRVYARELLKMDIASKHFIKLEKIAERERRKMSA